MPARSLSVGNPSQCLEKLRHAVWRERLILQHLQKLLPQLMILCFYC
jgi:hypothetical protein